MRSGITKLIILKILLKKGPKTGYELVKEIERITGGFWRPSPGGVYPLLSSLEEQGLIECCGEEGRKVYKITDLGKVKIEEFKKVEKELREKISALINVLASIIGEEDIKEIAYILVPENVPKKYKEIVKMEKEVIQIFARRVRRLLENEQKDLAIELLERTLKMSEEYLKKAGIKEKVVLKES
ncbi:MAG: helix-turn-helix transcriptional regulator [Euryarchaeota archaeon]|nr:helix-turn-helix transcriptional regulator [Euryarchaeota archaeon]MCD6158284.1 helix-turn-helix transcriptional regulator [Euryarchaeota archaeon]